MSGISASYACLFFIYLATGFGLKQTSSAPKPPHPRLLPAMDDDQQGGQQSASRSRGGWSDWQPGGHDARRSRGWRNEGWSTRDDDGQAGRQNEEPTWRQGDWQSRWHDASRSRGGWKEGWSRRDDDPQVAAIAWKKTGQMQPQTRNLRQNNSRRRKMYWLMLWL